MAVIVFAVFDCVSAGENADRGCSLPFRKPSVKTRGIAHAVSRKMVYAGRVFLVAFLIGMTQLAALMTVRPLLGALSCLALA